MGTTAIDPQTIRNVTIVGEPADTDRIVGRLHRHRIGAGAFHWATGGVDHTIRLTEMSARAPLAELERAIRVADAMIVVQRAAARTTAHLQTILRTADDHQVARMCLVTGLDQPGADFDRCLRAVADTRGATPLPLHLPTGSGARFDGVIDLVPLWSLAPTTPEFHGDRWTFAEQRYRDLAARDHPAPVPPQRWHDHIRRATRIGDAVPVLCDATPHGDGVTPLLDAIVRYLPSPLVVCQPEHTLDY